MIDRKQYELDMDKARREQIDIVADILDGYIKKSKEIRDMKINLDSDTDAVEYIRNVEIPREGRDPKEIADELVENVFSKSMLIQHPRFISLVTSAVSPYSLAGTVLADVYNCNAAGAHTAPAGNVIEEKLVKWMGSRAGYDTEKCGGVFTSGGSLSNLTGMIAGRDNKLTEEERNIGTAYLSDQAHSSVRKGLKMMGLRHDQIRILESDDKFHLDPKVLEKAVLEDIEKGYKPFLTIAVLGTTNTGSIDPFDEIADVCEKYNMWLHVDGAYGGSSLMSDIYNHLSKGIERSDSISWDTHKWGLQTYSCSTILAKDKNTFKTVFCEHPEYLADVMVDNATNGWDMGIEMSRPLRYIKLWYTLQAVGTDKMADLIDYAFFNAKVAETELKKLPSWQITSDPCCGCITFRYVPPSVDPSKYDDLNKAIAEKITSDGFAYVVTTVIKNMRVLRFCLINGNTTDTDVKNVVEYLGNIAPEIAKDFQ